MTVVRSMLAALSIVSATAFAAPARAPQSQPAPKSVPATPSSPGAQSQAAVTEPPTAPVVADTDADLTNPQALRLSLNDALVAAMKQNLGIDVQRYNYLEAGQLLVEQYGIFDWLATADIEQDRQISPPISRFQASGSRSTIADFGVSQLLPTGGSYSVSFNNSRLTTTGGGTTVNPAYRSALGVSVTQPLFRNFGIDVTEHNITIARNTLGINQDLFQGVLMDTAVSVEQAYLNLAYARQYVDVVKEALFLARDQARITQIRIDVGASAPLDILQPRVQIAVQDQALIAAVAAVRDAEDQLRAVMNLPTSQWDRPILPTSPITYAPVTINTEDAVARAYQLRPEMHEAELTTANKQIQYIFARNQALPRIDFVGTYNAAGLAGTTVVVDPVTGLPTGQVTSTSFGNALSQVFGANYPSYTFGFNIGVPILNIQARAEAKRSKLDLQLSRVSEAQERQNIAVAVRKAVRDIDTAAKEITASHEARVAAEQNVDAERKRYENGLATNFEVLQIQQQLTSARASELQALVGYNSALVTYHRAVGDLLDVADINVASPSTPSIPRIFPSFLERYNWLYYGNKVPPTTGETTPQ